MLLRKVEERPSQWLSLRGPSRLTRVAAIFTIAAQEVSHEAKQPTLHETRRSQHVKIFGRGGSYNVIERFKHFNLRGT